MGGPEQQEVIKGRLVSVDVLRGFDMFWIIGGAALFRNMAKVWTNPVTETINRQLSHAKWEGFHFWDLIMPLFLFVVGVAMPFSFGKRLARGDSKKKLYFHVLKRVLILLVLGLMAQGHLLEYDLSTLVFHVNTLHTIAAGYFISSLIILNLNIVWQMVTTAGLLLLFWALMVLVPLTGCGADMLTPDCNLAFYLDRLILSKLGLLHFWDADTGSMRTLSCITFGCNVMLGAMAGQLLRSEREQRSKVLWLFGVGVGCLALGFIWGTWFPIIKRLWTSSFVLFAGGWCYLLLALFYLVIDVLGLRKWAFGFVVIGMNAIVVYMATMLYDFRNIGNIFVGGLGKWLGGWNDFVQTAAAFAVVWLILYWMYRKRSFIKI